MRYLAFLRRRRKDGSVPYEMEAASKTTRVPRLSSNVVEALFAQFELHVRKTLADQEDNCPACAMRDLARCSSVNRMWHEKANKFLYNVVDIGTAHTCHLKSDYVDRPGKIQRSKIQLPSLRLQMFLRTVNESKQLGLSVIALKAGCATGKNDLANLARLIRSLPNLRDVDLPLPFYQGSSSTQMLRQELQAHCPDIRAMTYCSSAAIHFGDLARYNFWTNLEQLELSQLSSSAITIRRAVGNLRKLRVLKVSQMQTGDSFFAPIQGLPCLPPLEELSIEDDPAVTSAGLMWYLTRAEVAVSLTHLCVARTAVSALDLYSLLTKATMLKHLTFTQDVHSSIFTEQLSFQSGSGVIRNIPPMASASLESLTFDISPSRTCAWADAQSYYDYLLPSIQCQMFPKLRELLVLDADFVNRLLHSRQTPAPKSSLQSTVKLLVQPLEVYVKGVSELPWSSATLPMYFQSSMSDQVNRPIDASDISRARSSWTGEARKSVLLGNGVGDFFAVPQDPADSLVDTARTQLCHNATQLQLDNPHSRDRISKMDLWR